MGTKSKQSPASADVKDYLASMTELQEKFKFIKIGKQCKQQQLRELYQSITEPLEKFDR